MSSGASRAERAMGKYLLEGEEMVVAVNQHWFKIAGVLVAPVIAGILVILIGLVTPSDVGFIVEFSIYLWILLLLVCIVRVVLWRREWFVATDRRLLLSYGLVWRQMDMMPMGKVTDMSFNQSVGGRIFGYGTYVMESAGQDQALQRLDFIPDAENHYRSICAQIFGKEDDGSDDSNDSHGHRRDKASVGDDGYDDTANYDVDFDDTNYSDSSYDDERQRYNDSHRRYERDRDYDRDHTDPYGVPSQRLPGYGSLQQPDQDYDDDSTADHSGSDDGSEDEDQGWSVSREHVPDPQKIRRGRDGRRRDPEDYRP